MSKRKTTRPKAVSDKKATPSEQPLPAVRHDDVARIREGNGYKKFCADMMQISPYCRDPFDVHRREGLLGKSEVVVHWLLPNKYPKLLVVPGNALCVCLACERHLVETQYG